MNKLLLLILVFVLLTGIASAQESVTANDFTVTWYDCNYDLTKSSCKVDIQNLASVARDFNLTGLISGTDYNLNVHETQMVVYEWKISQTEIPVYEIVLVNQTCYTYNNETNTSSPYDCPYNQTIQNGTKFVNMAQWKASKTHILKNPDSVKANYGLITIPKYGSKPKVDDFNTTETNNGTKTFKIEWTTPIIKSDRGYGSSGKIVFVDEISEIEYHPWWDISWSSRIDNTITDGVRPYQISLNLSNSTGTNNATHVYCNGKCNVNFTDIRFTLDNTTALPYWIEDNVTGKVWVNITVNGTVNMYYGNPSATTTSNVNTTFIREISGVIGAWDLNGDALDRSGNGNNGTLQGGMGYVTGKFGQAGSFDGGDDYVSVPDSPLWAFGDSNFSIDMWVKFNVTNGIEGLIGQSTGGGGVTKWFLVKNLVPWSYSANNIFFDVAVPADNYKTWTATTTTSWTHVVITRSGTSFSLYYNGSLISTQSMTVTVPNIANTLRIGADGEGWQFTQGLISTVRIYNTQLSESEVTDIYNNFGYVTTNYAGKELVRKYVSPEPVWATWGIETGQDTTPPTYSGAAHNRTTAGLVTLFSIKYNDETALHSNGQWIFSTNNSGGWVNESAVNWTATPEWANVTKTLNSTVGTVVGYRWYASDEVGNVNNTPIYTVVTDISFIVSGYVNNALGSFVEDARVEYIGGNYTFTDGSGYYSISVPSGTRDILSRAIGYRNNTETLIISADTVQNFTMKERTPGTVSMPGFGAISGIFIIAVTLILIRTKKRSD